MKRFRLDMAQAVRDLLIHLPPPLKGKVKLAFQTLAKDPYQAKPLKDELAGLRSFRVMRSRIILRIKGASVEIVAFGPRKNIYHRAATELRKAHLLDLYKEFSKADLPGIKKVEEIEVG